MGVESKLRKFNYVEVYKNTEVRRGQTFRKAQKRMASFMDVLFGNPFGAERIIRKGKVGEAGSRREVDSSLLDRAAAADSVTNLYYDFPLCCPGIYQ